MVESVAIEKLYEDEANPRKPDDVRLKLLQLSIAKLGYMMPIFATPEGMILSGHQRLFVSKLLGLKTIPVEYVHLTKKQVRGVNVLFNRCTNDFSAFDTGSGSKERLNLTELLEEAEQWEDFLEVYSSEEDYYAYEVEDMPVKDITVHEVAKYDKKAIIIANSLQRMGVEIPVVLTESGRIVNGLYRVLSAKELDLQTWPVITIPDDWAEMTGHFLNYLSMDFSIDDEYKDLMRMSAFRRPQNNRGAVPKAYRFFANGYRTLPDKDSYSTAYWRKFRDIHGDKLIDFGAGLCKVAPFLRKKGMQCIDFEPYRIDEAVAKGKPSPLLSKAKAQDFLEEVREMGQIDSIFLASVMNSVPFPRDRMVVLACVHALCSFNTVIYGTCRDISDFNYEYGGIRNANYFVFDTEPSVRIGDVMHNPKIQKFHTQEEAQNMFQTFWESIEFWPGGNIFYFRLKNPKRVSPQIISQAIELEYDLPYQDGTTMGMVDLAKEVYGERLGIKIP
jgi:hypothetical protein